MHKPLHNPMHYDDLRKNDGQKTSQPDKIESFQNYKWKPKPELVVTIDSGITDTRRGSPSFDSNGHPLKYGLSTSICPPYTSFDSKNIPFNQESHHPDAHLAVFPKKTTQLQYSFPLDPPNG